MTDDILQLVDNWRTFQINNDKFKEIQKEMRLKTKQAKEEFFKWKCEEIEELQAKDDHQNVHKKLKEFTHTPILKRMKKQREILLTIKRRKLKCSRR